jgi:DNA-directed RNA polymerase beta subunit
LRIVNPFFHLSDGGIFELREKDYASIEQTVREMLKPAEEAGFVIREFELRDQRPSVRELMPTLKKNLVIVLEKNNSVVNLTTQIPKLVDGNYIVISGRKKVPLFQLFDLPIVTRGKSIKLRTNVATLSLTVKDKKGESDPFYVSLNFMNKDVPFSLVLFCCYGFDRVVDMFGLDKLTELPSNSGLLGKLECDFFSYYSESKEYTQEDFVRELGRYYTSYDAKKKGEEVVYALDLIAKVDVPSSRFFTTESAVSELLQALRIGHIDDTDFRNKRIRCFEYIVLAKLARDIYNLCIASRNALRPKFSTNSKQVISECKTSSIIQYDQSLNPIDELTKLSRVSLAGPGAFTKENVPEYLRDVHPSMFGRVCSVDTPERENCGVLQSLLPKVKLTEHMRFDEEVEDKATVSIAVSMVPFLEHDDQTRLQMASSQMRQAVTLLKVEKPYIRSGCEGLYTDYSSFIKRARKNGEIVYRDESFCVVVYDDKDFDIFKVGFRKTQTENIDFLVCKHKVGDKVKAGDIVVESFFCTNGEIKIGKNLLTVLATWHGLNYEDAILISEEVRDRGDFTSLHFIDLSFVLPPNKILLDLSDDSKGKTYRPLPTPYSKIVVKRKDKVFDMQSDNEVQEEVIEDYSVVALEKGQKYAVVKEMYVDNDVEKVFEEEQVYRTERDVKIYSVNIYANKWYDKVRPFDEWVQETIRMQQKRERDFHESLYKFIPREKVQEFIRDNGLNKFTSQGSYRINGELINGMYIEILGVYEKPINVGDKIGNRHGNKGVVNILPKEKMPLLENGRHAEVCVSPMSTISRMNVGQIFEMHLAMSLQDLKANLLKMIEDGKSQEEMRKYLLDYIKIVDATKDNWFYNQFESQLGVIDKKFVDDLTLVQPPFESCSREQILEACKYTNTPLECSIYDPITGEKVLNKVGFGYMYFFKMVHIAEDRLAARGIGTYSKRTLQPLGGRRNRGGQRVGEMEMCCFIAHDATENLYETLTTKSDSIDLKNEYLRTILGSDFVRRPDKIDDVPEAVKLLDSYCLVVGVKTKSDKKEGSE